MVYRGEKIEVIFQQIDGEGGWPADKKYLCVAHDIGDRALEFTNEYRWNEWWSTLATADDYYWWKISQEFKDKIRAEHAQEFRKIIGRIKL